MTPSTSPSTPQPAPAVSPGIVPVKRRHFLRQVFRLAGPYWKCERRAKIRAATLSLFLLTVAQVGLTVWGNYWNRALFDALEQRSVRGVLIQVAVFALIFAISIVVTGAHLLVKRWLQLDWRAWLTDQLMGRWMEDGRHYRLLFTAMDPDTDQRMSANRPRIRKEKTSVWPSAMALSVAMRMSSAMR